MEASKLLIDFLFTVASVSDQCNLIITMGTNYYNIIIIILLLLHIKEALVRSRDYLWIIHLSTGISII